MNLTMLDVCLKQNKPKIVVGDSHQQIKNKFILFFVVESEIKHDEGKEAQRQIFFAMADSYSHIEWEVVTD